MTATEIRRSFLDFFQARGHEARPSSSLIPAGDPTLLFTNAGMVQFKGAFLGLEKPPFRRAVTSQKCVRAGGKHNDLEEVGRTARHHTFFEMLGNFSFGDYFKRDAVEYAWEFLTSDLGLAPERLFVTVHHSDDEAADLWNRAAGVPPERIHRLGDRDNFWQMADTGPCGPCSEVHYDLRPRAERRTAPDTPEFEALGEAGEFLELWNLVFMQFDRGEDGVLHPLPAPSIDTGAGLERLASVLQGAGTNYHTDLFLPLLDCVAEVAGRAYEADAVPGVSYRVLADHARAVAFLLADGVFPSNEGRGYVLRRILRRAVRHAWLLGMREPVLADVVAAVVEQMADAYPELSVRRDHLLATTRSEEERFLATVEGGLARLDALAPRIAGRSRVADEAAGADADDSSRHVVSGKEVFRLYDTFGFPADLTRIVAAERGWDVDMPGFEQALAEQRERSRADRRTSAELGNADAKRGKSRESCVVEGAELRQRYVAHESLAVETRILGRQTFRDSSGERLVGLALEEHPFYVEGGGQVSDRGRIAAIGQDWSMEVDAVVRDCGLIWVKGRCRGKGVPARVQDFLNADVVAQVDPSLRRDAERNHTATHLLHAALRALLGSHVVQRGSLVEPDRLRFDFAHSAPMTAAEVSAVEARVNEDVWAGRSVQVDERPYDEAVEAGAVALFGEKYGERVRVVDVVGVGMELCGGTHVRLTSEIGPFKLVSETGVAAGVRRLEAVTGRAALRYLDGYRRRVEAMAAALKTGPADVERRMARLQEQNAELEAALEAARRSGADGGAEVLVELRFDAAGGSATYRAVRLRVRSPADARKWGDAFRESSELGVAVVVAEMSGGKHALFAFSTDGAVAAGLRADKVLGRVAAETGGKGGGRPHMAQAGVGDPAKLSVAVASGAEFAKALAQETQAQDGIAAS